MWWDRWKHWQVNKQNTNHATISTLLLLYSYCVKKNHNKAMLCSDIHYLSEWMLSWTERWVGGGGSRCDDRWGSRTSLGGLEQSISSYTHRPTGYIAAVNAWPSSSQSDVSRIFRVYIKNRPFPEDTGRDSYMCHIHSFNWERKTSNTPDGDTFLIENSEKCDITLAGFTGAFFQRL